MECLNLILGIVHVFVSSLNSLISSLDLQLILQGVDLSSLNLFLFESPNSVFIFFLSQSINGVWPVLNSCLGKSLQILSVLESDFLIVLRLRSSDTLLPDAFQLVVRYNRCVLLRLLVSSSVISWARGETSIATWFWGQQILRGSGSENLARARALGKDLLRASAWYLRHIAILNKIFIYLTSTLILLYS